jgi:hypothetical protein
MAIVEARSPLKYTKLPVGGVSIATRSFREASTPEPLRPRLLDRIRQAHMSRRTEEAYVAWIRRYIFQPAWVVYCKPPFAGPEHVLAYLSRYTHRVALSNHRLLAVADGRVHFHWRDYADGDRVKVMALDADEFLRRFLVHVVPDGFVRARYVTGRDFANKMQDVA